MVSTKEDATTKDLMFALNKGVYGSSILIAIVAFFVTKWMLPPEYSLGVFFAMVIGLLAGILIGVFTERSTSYSFKATRGIAKQAEYGPATVIIDGLAVGMKSTGAPVIIIAIAILSAFAVSKGFSIPEMGLYGIGFGAVGMLSTLGVTLAMDAFGPIADNAGGNAEMSKLPKEVRERTDALDSVGNTTAATGKGFAIGSAALTAMALLASYLEEVRTGLKFAGETMIAGVDLSTATIANFVEHYNITLMNPKMLIGLFIGAMVTFVFAALTLKAVDELLVIWLQKSADNLRKFPASWKERQNPNMQNVCLSLQKALRKKWLLRPFLAFSLLLLLVSFLVFPV